MVLVRSGPGGRTDRRVARGRQHPLAGPRVRRGSLVPAPSRAAFAYVGESDPAVSTVAWAAAVPVALGAADPPTEERWYHGGPGRRPGGRCARHPGAPPRRGRGTQRRGAGPGGRPAAETRCCAGRDFYGSLAVSPGESPPGVGRLGPPEHALGRDRALGGRLRRRRRARPRRSPRVGARRLDGCSVDQPVWLDDGALVFLADAAGWWQPWRSCRPGASRERLVDDRGGLPGPGLGARPAHRRRRSGDGAARVHRGGATASTSSG